ncbi:hypothetical protein Sulac_1278 [Sulfobacillus acidophilus DSM 10332]|uniref:DUF1453 domain-containing protein n=1 Tax=Sulfobacillus acidophilus (strain ATCC 700253 / DSM 10332 / NAL) TaxID=679936 RepID=G8TVT1_SULAD|nr:hypothetical protein Sulac_1278 [Sulfobacillus acidophilus DSM 10332]
MNAGSMMMSRLLILLIAGTVIYWRARRNLGPQIVRPGVLIGRVVLSGGLGLLLVGGVAEDGILWAGMAIGAGVGIVLAVLSLRHTRFTVQPPVVQYQANPYIGGAVIGVTVLRIIDDALFPVTVTSARPSHVLVAGMKGAVTEFFLLLFLAYWFGYSLGLLRAAHRLLPPKTPGAI